MSETPNEKLSLSSALTDDEALALRWDTVSYKIQGTPYEQLTVSALSKNTGVNGWTRPVKGKADTADLFSSKSYDELCMMRGMDHKHVELIIKVFEETVKFEDEVGEMGSFDSINELAVNQRMRFVEQFGLHHDFPIALSNFDQPTRDLCVNEGVTLMIQLMDFIDRLSDRSTLGGAFRELQAIFAHGDEVGLSRYFPFRRGYRGFHLPEALSFCLKRLSAAEQNQVFDYYRSTRKRRLFMQRKPEVPAIIGRQLVPEIMDCVIYFGERQQQLLKRLDDAAYICRELMFLEDPETENLLQWCLHIVQGMCLPSYKDADDELVEMDLPPDPDRVQNVKALFDASSELMSNDTGNGGTPS